VRPNKSEEKKRIAHLVVNISWCDWPSFSTSVGVGHTGAFEKNDLTTIWILGRNKTMIVENKPKTVLPRDNITCVQRDLLLLNPNFGIHYIHLLFMINHFYITRYRLSRIELVRTERDLATRVRRKKAKTTALRIPAWSPTVVLTERHTA
jgi:hypothetical protein